MVPQELHLAAAAATNADELRHVPPRADALALGVHLVRGELRVEQQVRH
jgi:hypothetical protein